MKYLYLSILILFISFSISAQIYVEPEKDVDCTIFLKKDGRGRAQQGLEIIDNYIFSCEDGGHVNIYDFNSRDSKPIAGFELASSHPDNHVNNVCFGIEKKHGASFPLLYITNGKVGSSMEWKCFVESIVRRGRHFSSEIVQTIILDSTGWDKEGYVPIFGAPSWMVDIERGDLWVFSARKRTIAKVTKHAWENQYIATKFRIPKLSDGKEICLGKEDIIDQVVFPFEVWFTQAGCVHDGKIYFCFGVGKQDDKRPSCIRIFDTDSRTITARYNVQEQIIYEPEDIVVKDGYMYVNTNTNPHKTQELPCIFKLSLPKNKDIALTPEEKIRQKPERAAGIYFVEDLSNTVTLPPDGYKPFYINGYFRHGARHIDNSQTYSIIYDVIEKAFAENNLTEFGKAIFQRLEPFKKNILYKEGDLTKIGYNQALEIGRRMVINYPEVFDDNPYLKTNSTNVLRVASTMQALNSGILSLRPELRWNEVDNSRSFLTTLNPYGNECPGRSLLDKYILSKESKCYQKYNSYIRERIDAKTILSRLFVDIDMIDHSYDRFDLVHHFWLMASVMQCLDRQVPIWDIFTEKEIITWAELENYRYFSLKGPEPISHGRSWMLGSRTLRHLLEESNFDINSNRHGINLNFGHDGVLMAIMTNLGVGDWAHQATNSQEAFKYWNYWDIPMGANLQMVFYKSEKNHEILVKFMLNEKDLKLPLKEVTSGYYKWCEVYKYYLTNCDKSEESLAQTLKLSYEDF